MEKYIGQKFHNFTVISEVPSSKSRRFLCRCICGRLSEQYMSNISHSRRGHVERCRACASLGRRKRHGKTTSREYRIWVNMKARCDNSKDSHYPAYGGRGISYTPTWSTFEGFWNDMAEGYNDNLTLDRIENNGNYNKENCRWATRGQQNMNRRNSIHIRYNNTSDSLTGWSKRTGVPRSVIDYRIKQGWPLKNVFRNNKSRCNGGFY